MRFLAPVLVCFAFACASSDDGEDDNDDIVGVCGDGRVDATSSLADQAAERCDDGNTSSGDGCSATCQLEHCGNGVADPWEECDDGNRNDLDQCRNGCQDARCGDGVVSIDEACDAGTSTASCDDDCTSPSCGDGITNVAAGEQCDDSNDEPGDGCFACKYETSFLRTTTPQLSFDTVAVGNASRTVFWTLTNSSTVASTSPFLPIASSNDDFVIVDNGCAPEVLPTGLPPEASCTIGIIMTPSEEGVVLGTFIVSTDVGGTVTGGLAGFGSPGAALRASPSFFDFGAVARLSAAAHTFTLVNTGDVEAGSSDFGDSTDNLSFYIYETTCNGFIAPGGSCTFGIRFEPQLEAPIGFAQGVVTIGGTPGGLAQVHLNGTVSSQ